MTCFFSQASSTLLSLSEEGLTYRDFYSAIIKLLMAGSLQEVKSDSEEAQSVSRNAVVVKRCFSLTWRILHYLPPSVEFFSTLSQDLEMQHLNVTVSRIILEKCRHELTDSPHVVYFGMCSCTELVNCGICFHCNLEIAAMLKNLRTLQKILI